MATEADQFDLLAADLPKQYELLAKIRVGGMGAIYKAQNRFTKQVFAIKVLNPEGANDPQTRQRFTAEAKAASSLKHDNICQVIDFGVTDSELLFLVMEWIEGISIEQKVDRDGPLSANEVMDIFIQIGNALSFAHSKGVIHRDLKPDNVMLSRDERSGANVVRIVDFGIAKVLRPDGDSKSSREGLTQHGTVVGTPGYMSPEQARAKDVDARSDIYALGCVMYFSLSGRPPFLGDNYVDVLYQHVKDPPPLLDPRLKVPPKLVQLMFKTMEKKPEDRYQSMDAVVADLKNLVKGVGIKLKPLAKDRAKMIRTAINLAIFVAAFCLVSSLSLFVQDNAHPTAKTTDGKSGGQVNTAGAAKRGK